MLALLLAAAIAAPSYITPPPGWTANEPPPDAAAQGIAKIWLPPRTDGQNILLIIHPRTDGTSLQDAVWAVKHEEAADGRTILGTTTHATCQGKLAGTDVDMRFGTMAAQFFHITVDEQHVYTLIYTHSPKDKGVSDLVRHAIDSFCAP